LLHSHLLAVASESHHEGCSGPSLSSPLIDQEMMRSSGWFSWFKWMLWVLWLVEQRRASIKVIQLSSKVLLGDPSQPGWTSVKTAGSVSLSRGPAYSGPMRWCLL